MDDTLRPINREVFSGKSKGVPHAQTEDHWVNAFSYLRVYIKKNRNGIKNNSNTDWYSHNERFNDIPEKSERGHRLEKPHNIIATTSCRVVIVINYSDLLSELILERIEPETDPII